MPKYKALQLLWSLELEREIQPEEEFEVTDDSNFGELVDMGVVEPVVETTKRRKETLVVEESNAPNN